MLVWKVTTAATTEPVTLVEAKLHLRVDISTDDDLITSLIKVARDWCENYQNRAYISQTITAKFDRFPTIIRLPRSPLISVTSIAYIDSAGDSQTIDSSVYEVDTTSEPGLVTLAFNQLWPSTRRIHHAITVVYKAGFGADATAVPDRIKAAMKLVIGHLYEHREEDSEIVLTTLPMGVKSLLSGDRCFE